MNSTAPEPIAVAPMPPDPVRRAVAVATRRLRLRRTIRTAATGLGIGSIVGFGVAVLLSANVVSEAALPGGAAFLLLPSLAGLVAGGFVGAAVRYDPVGVARFLEARLPLGDRLSSALGASGGDAVFAAQQRDAAQHAPADAAVLAAIPMLPLPRRVYIAAGLTLAVGLAYFAPVLPVFWSPARVAERAAVRKEGERLLAVAKAAEEEADKKHLPEAKKAAEKVAALGTEMTHGRMRLKDALIQRAKLGDELQKAQERIAAERAKANAVNVPPTNLPGAGKDFGKAMQGANVAPTGENNAGTPDARMKALQDALDRGDKSAAAKALRDMADAADRGEPAAGAERDKTAKQLGALGDGLTKNGAGDAGKSAGDAGAKMKDNAMPGAAQSLRDAARQIEAGQQTPTPPAPSRNDTKSDPTSAALQKLGSAMNKQTASGDPNAGAKGNSGSSQAGQQASQSSPAQSGSQGQQGSPSGQPQGAQSGQSGQQGQNGQGAQGKSGSGEKGGSGQGKDGQNKSGSQSGQSGAGKQGGTGAKSGQGQGQGSGAKSGAGNGAGKGNGRGTGGSKSSAGKGNGIGNGSSGTSRVGESERKMERGANEQNISGKRSGMGPETVITETDNDRSSLPVSTLPYYQEFVRKRGGAATEAAQQKDAVPNAYRKQVRGYFADPPGKGQ